MPGMKIQNLGTSSSQLRLVTDRTVSTCIPPSNDRSGVTRVLGDDGKNDNKTLGGHRGSTQPPSWSVRSLI